MKLKKYILAVFFAFIGFPASISFADIQITVINWKTDFQSGKYKNNRILEVLNKKIYVSGSRDGVSEVASIQCAIPRPSDSRNKGKTTCHYIGPNNFIKMNFGDDGDIRGFEEYTKVLSNTNNIVLSVGVRDNKFIGRVYN